jgi:hypothetical protein
MAEPPLFVGVLQETEEEEAVSLTPDTPVGALGAFCTAVAVTDPGVDVRPRESCAETANSYVVPGLMSVHVTDNVVVE